MVQPVSSGDDTPGLVDPSEHRSNCGVGVVMDVDGSGGHDIVADGIELLENLEHRGTTGAEEDTGDGAGMLLRTPRNFFADVTDFDLPDSYAVGSLFLPRETDAAAGLKDLIAAELREHDLEVVGWRSVPTDNSDLGQTALDSEPAITQVFVAPDGLSTDAFDRALYVARKAIESRVEREDPPGAERFYVCSLDRQTVVYKGLLKGDQLAGYFPDLSDERVQSSFVLVHARFSTNTLGAWHLAHPYRNIIHNGEFNTIQGNINWMRARETDLEHAAFGEDIEAIKPIIDDPDQSDTASVDNALELLMEGGRDLPHALRMLIPEAWRAEENDIPADREAWYDFHASLVEPWDGPALVIATDGDRVGGVLDRNGLRPCRYEVTSDGRLIMGSEAGALETDPANVERRGRLQPGELFLAEPGEGIVPEEEVFDDLTDEHYGEWVANEQVGLDDLVSDPATVPDGTLEELRQRQVAFGYTHDELDNLIEPMAKDGKDPVGSMGDDTPLTVLSDFNRPLSSYFKQLFAQVSNPPVDNIREELVFSLETRLGNQRNLLDESPEHANQLVLDSPILRNDELASVAALEGGLTATTIDITFDHDVDLETAVDRVREAAAAAADDHDVIVLSDRNLAEDRLAVPSLLATGAVHHHLVRNGLRNHVGLVVESGEPRTVHDVCTLVGYGAGAINPYLAYRTIEDIVAGPDGADPAAAIEAYIKALEDGLLKVMSKMGISTVESYQGAQIFEAVGLDSGFVAEYFEGTENRTEGIGIAEIEEDLRERHETGFGEDPEIERQGEFENRTGGIHHQWNPDTVGNLQQAVRSGDYETYQEFASAINDQHEELQTLRGLLEFDSDRDPVPIEEVEPVTDIVERFSTAAMSLGSISPEAHENNAIAMNRLGAKSNTGEGGEPPERFDTEKESKVKQVASGRFGVTNAYLASADELQIKMAQGSKPGEGGHLPGHKVVEHIAHTRQTVPGVDLISPPPQHDIYSIEDLKQLIHDLHAANPEANVNVKLVAEAGVGIIAAGVAKANADVVHISGHDGGTGASPKTSIKNAGVPWELGVAEANQMLKATGLRDRIRVSTDGGMKTGRDVAVAALLGAEEYVFGTASLVTSGCVMARICHTNNCPVGVATQKEKLRDRFPGQPDHVINYMTFIAQELREIMAELGFTSVEEMIGRPDVLSQRETDHPKARSVDLSAILADPDSEYDVDRYKTQAQSHGLEDALDWGLIEDARPAIENGEPVEIDAEIRNRNRAVGATLSNRVAREHGHEGMTDDMVRINFEGAAGQSFGAFLASGVTLDLEGVANDYVGKGLSGGKLILRTPEKAPFEPEDNTLIGNVALYGATGGEVYVEGVAGERFAVRNSGVKAVVEGVGDHGCEYMTGGAVVVIGETGKNFAAGMSGGVAYVYDPDDRFRDRVNTDMVSVTDELVEKDRAMIGRLVENHAAYTDSDRANALLENWEEAIGQFTKVMPDAYAEAIKKYTDADVRDEPPAIAGSAGDSGSGVAMSTDD
jgi:glutamate synthase (NADPH/NADH) large chain